MTQIKKGDQVYWTVGPGGFADGMVINLVTRVVRINAETAMIRFAWIGTKYPSVHDPLWEAAGARPMRIRRARKKRVWPMIGEKGFAVAELVPTNSPYNPEVILRVPRDRVKPCNFPA